MQPVLSIFKGPVLSILTNHNSVHRESNSYPPTSFTIKIHVQVVGIVRILVQTNVVVAGATRTPRGAPETEGVVSIFLKLEKQ